MRPSLDSGIRLSLVGSSFEIVWDQKEGTSSAARTGGIRVKETAKYFQAQAASKVPRKKSQQYI